MPLSNYNGFSGTVRDLVDKLHTLWIKEGHMPEPTTCYLCGQFADKYHLEDYYKGVLDMSKPMCRYCHLYLHCSINRHPELWRKYQIAVINGAFTPPTDLKWQELSSTVFSAIDRGEFS